MVVNLPFCWLNFESLIFMLLFVIVPDINLCSLSLTPEFSESFDILNFN